MSIAMEVYRSCRQEVESRGGGLIDTVRLRVGELSGVEPDLLQFAWRAVAEGSAEPNAKLEINYCRALQSCPNCGSIADRQPGTWLRLCPDCAEPLRIEGGGELQIESIDFEPQDETVETPG